MAISFIGVIIAFVLIAVAGHHGAFGDARPRIPR